MYIRVTIVKFPDKIKAELYTAIFQTKMIPLMKEKSKCLSVKIVDIGEGKIMSTNGSNGARAMGSKDLDGSVVNDNSGHAPPLHCIRQVREQQNTSLRRAARQLGKNIHEASRQEEETSDLRLSELYAWQKLLGVPAADLLIDNDTPLSRPVLERARLVRMMKTAAAIREECQTKPIERLAERLIDQLVENVGTLPAACQVEPAVSSFFSIRTQSVQPSLAK